MAASSPSTEQERVSWRTLRQQVKRGDAIAMLTCYDAVMANLLWRGGIRTLLVGDTAAQMVLGHDSTLPAKMDFMLTLTAAVRRGAPLAFVMADMPFGSYQCGDDEALRHATAFMADAGADGVKLEADESHAGLIGRMASAGIPVIAHLGSRPQHKRIQGRYRKVYHSQGEVDALTRAAVALVDAGATAVLLEAVPAEAARQVVDAVTHRRADGEPTIVIGCGAGPACHGHVVVLHDVLGLTDWHAPFAPPMVNLGEQVVEGARRWGALIRSGRYLRDDHPYRLEEK